MVSKKQTGFYDKKNLGLTLVEALVATVIVGIGFISVFQMVRYSIESVDTSSNRTKTSFLANMVVEDILSNKDSKKNDEKFYDFLKDNNNSGWKMNTCSNGSGERFLGENNAPDNKLKKWTNYFAKERIKCRGDSDTKELQVFNVCNRIAKDEEGVVISCDYKNNKTYAYKTKDLNGAEEDRNIKILEPRYFGRMEVKLNNGKKTKYLYFQIK